MKESPERLSAFDYYFYLGPKRSYAEVARKYQKSVHTIYRWSKALSWPSRVEIRDIEVSNQVRKETDNMVVKAKASYREEIKNYLHILNEIIVDVIKEDSNGNSVLNVKATDVKSLTKALKAYDSLAKLDLGIMGEPTELTVDRIDVNIVGD